MLCLSHPVQWHDIALLSTRATLLALCCVLVRSTDTWCRRVERTVDYKEHIMYVREGAQEHKMQEHRNDHP